ILDPDNVEAEPHALHPERTDRGIIEHEEHGSSWRETIPVTQPATLERRSVGDFRLKLIGPYNDGRNFGRPRVSIAPRRHRWLRLRDCRRKYEHREYQRDELVSH